MKRMYSAPGIVKGSLPILVADVVIGLVAGVVLNKWVTVLISLPGLLLLLPAFVDMGGSLVAVLSSRIDSALQLDLIRPRLKHNKMVEMDEESIVASSLISFFGLAVIAGTVSWVTGLATLPLHLLVALTVGAGVLSLVIVSALAILISFFVYRHGGDPDDVAIPLMTNLEDLIGIVFILLFVGLVV